MNGFTASAGHNRGQEFSLTIGLTAQAIERIPADARALDDEFRAK
jgi:hypothetical protein